MLCEKLVVFDLSRNGGMSTQSLCGKDVQGLPVASVRGGIRMTTTQPPKPPARERIVLVGAQDLADAGPALQAAGFEITALTDAKKVFSLSEFKPKQWTPSLFIVDMSLSGTSGFELVRRLTSIYGDSKIPVPIIMVSSYPCPEDMHEATQAGALTLLKKPLELEALEECLEKERMRRLKAEIGSIVMSTMSKNG